MIRTRNLQTRFFLPRHNLPYIALMNHFALIGSKNQNPVFILPGEGLERLVENHQRRLVVAVEELDVDDVAHIVRLETNDEELGFMLTPRQCYLKAPVSS